MIPGREKRSVDMGIGPRGPKQMAGPMDIAPRQPATPPGLRDAVDEMRSCGACRHFGEEGGCSQFGGYPVEASQECDAFEAQAEMPAAGMGDVGTDPFEMEA